MASAEAMRQQIEAESRRAEELETLAADLKVARLRAERAETNVSVEKQLADERHSALSDLQSQLAQISLDKKRLASEKADLENALEAEQEYIMHKLHKQLMQLQNDKKALLGEKQNLKDTVSKLGSSVKKLSQEKVDLEAAMEMEEEAFVNKLMRQLLKVMDKYHKMEQVLDRHGIKLTYNSDSPRPSLNRISRDSTSSRRSGCSTSATLSHLGGSMSLGGGTIPAATASTAPSTPARRESSSAKLEGATGREASGRETSGRRTSSGRAGASTGVAKREDSSSSLGSAMSAISRDVSVTRESLSAMMWTRD